MTEHQAIQSLFTRLNILDRRVCCLTTALCVQVFDCLDISPDGSDSLFLNQQGDWVSASGSSQDLQGVTDIGNTTTNEIETHLQDGEASIRGYNFNNQLTLSLFSGGDGAYVEVTSYDGSDAYTVDYSSLNIRVTTPTNIKQLDFPSGDSVTQTLATSVNGELADNTGNIVLTTNITSSTIRNYGTSYTVLTTDEDVEISGAGTGVTSIDISLMAIGQTCIFSDLDNKATLNPISIDSGSGNTISALSGIAQSYSITVNGESATIKRITSTKFKIQ